MIWESGPWKQELWRLVNRCEDQYRQMTRIRSSDWWHNASMLMQMEKAVFLSAFIMRKMIDSRRLSMQVEAQTLQVTICKVRDAAEAPDPENWEQLERFYDIESGETAGIPLRDLLNWLIHSFVFVLEEQSDLAGGRVPTAFWCNSDRTKAREVVRVPWNTYRGVIDSVVRDDVVSILTLRDGRGEHVQLRSSTHLTEAEAATFRNANSSLLRRSLSTDG